MVQANIVGDLNGITILLPGMKERRHGTIINISSAGGRTPFFKHAVYCGTKFSVYTMAKQIREEMAPFNVRLIIIAPGFVETELLTHISSEKTREGYEKWRNEIGRPLTSDDIARSILFAYQQPQSGCIREILIAPTTQDK